MQSLSTFVVILALYSCSKPIVENNAVKAEGQTDQSPPKHESLETISEEIKDKENNVISLLTYNKSAKEGSVFIIKLEGKTEIKELTGTFNQRRLMFFPVVGSDNSFQAYIGIEFGKDKDSALLNLNICNSADKNNCTIFSKSILITKTEYQSEILKVPPRSVEPTKKDLVRIKKEQQKLNLVYSQSVSEILWDPPIQLPVNNDITSKYGTHRVYNGQKSGIHYGTDFRAPTGTPIYAPLKGKVVLAQNLFFTGWTVILDHGYNFFTVYAHMSKLFVHTGNVVPKNTKLGLSGATGRASGPHLHWGVKFNGAKVDPMSVLEIMK